MLKAKVLGSYVNKAYKFMRRMYIEKGYFASGSINMNDIYTRIHDDKEKAEIIVDQLLESEKVQIRRDCLELAFELTVEERSALIKEHNLAEIWEDKSPAEAHGEIYSVIREVKRNEKKLRPKQYSHFIKEAVVQGISEQLSFSVTKEVKKNEKKLRPKHYSSFIKEAAEKGISEQLSFDLQVG